ncbi:hypothetical protein [Olegusella massiliensis]|uniref:hypothetical protein n=1 Tax=Olegusella massiliensis TaxID=1776381 RepID=UPI000B12B0B0|nr:hypothetical protein [Olegusella massiliensis]
MAFDIRENKKVAMNKTGPFLRSKTTPLEGQIGKQSLQIGKQSLQIGKQNPSLWKLDGRSIRPDAWLFDNSGISA